MQMLHHYICRYVDSGWGKAPQSFYPIFGEYVGQLLRCLRRHGQYPHIDLITAQVVFQFGDMLNLKHTHPGTYYFRRCIENSDYLKTAPAEAIVIGKRSTEVSSPDQHHFVPAIQAQNRRYRIVQIVDPIAITLLTKAAEVA